MPRRRRGPAATPSPLRLRLRNGGRGGARGGGGGGGGGGGRGGVQSMRVTIPANGAKQVAFNAIAVPTGATRGVVRLTADSLPINDAMNFTIAPDEAVSVLLVEPSSPREHQSLFTARALEIGTEPPFRVEVKRVSALAPGDFDRRALVVLDEAPPPSGVVGTRLRAFVEAGGGVLIVPGDGAV